MSVSLDQLILILEDIWLHLVAIGHILVAIVASSHAILYKRDSRAAVAWVGLIWLSPLVGSLLYFLFGINRIRRKAVVLQSLLKKGAEAPAEELSSAASAEALHQSGTEYLNNLVCFVDRAVEKKLTKGNSVVPYQNGDEAYPEMLRAIESATSSICLASYIFDRDKAGEMFVDALAKAVQRNIEVRVLIDAAGARYSFPTIIRSLRARKIKSARFLPTLVPWRMPYMNLRNHRKILVVDGKVGFTGGLNIREGNLLENKPDSPTQDLHFKFEGPVVIHLQEAFVRDWAFATKEVLDGEAWFPSPVVCGNVLSRGIPDGPGMDFEKIRWTLLGAISMAKSRIRIMTPYFLPDATLIASLNVAAMSGVQVEIILPAENNLRFVHWASMSLLWQLLERGCTIYLQEPPFDHSKVMVVDDSWVLIGSSNWDPRSLRLNFEYNIECYDKKLATQMIQIFEIKRAKSRKMNLSEMDARKLPVRLRDGIVRLFTPYL